MTITLVTAAALLAAFALAACGFENDDTADEPAFGEPNEERTSTTTAPEDEATQVIDEWATALTEGDIDAAAALFAIPSVAQNGIEVEIEALEDAEAFNASLPCGAELVETTSDGEFTVATFRLIERPGAGTCGGDGEATAQTAFMIEDGLIVEWRRVVPGGEGGPQTPSSAI